MTCTNDTDGDGGCGRRMCPACGPEARALAVHVEAAANQPTAGPDAPDAAAEPAEPSTVEVSISAFNRSVEVKAPGTLSSVSETALRLWRQTSDPSVQPVGAMGFFLGEPGGLPPSPVRGLDQVDVSAVPRAA